MPYFLLVPAYVLLLVGLLVLALCAWCVPETRRLSSYVACGALGTIPAFLAGNVLYFLLGLGVVRVTLLALPDGVEGPVAAGGLVLLLLGLGVGLLLVNVASVVAGFAGGVGVRLLFARRARGRLGTTRLG